MGIQWFSSLYKNLNNYGFAMLSQSDGLALDEQTGLDKLPKINIVSVLDLL